MATPRYPCLRTRLGRLAALTVVMTIVIPSAAFASSCPVQATTTPFAQWGDVGNYSLVPGGNFESPLGISGWIVNRAERTLGNEPFYVGGSSDSHSLTIDSGGIAVSPTFCVDDTMRDFRFFAHAYGADGDLQVRLVMQTATGPISTPLRQVFDLPASSMPNWAPTGEFNVADGVTLATGQSALGRLVFDVEGRSSWQIDDIYIDPYRTG